MSYRQVLRCGYFYVLPVAVSQVYLYPCCLCNRCVIGERWVKVAVIGRKNQAASKDLGCLYQPYLAPEAWLCCHLPR